MEDILNEITEEETGVIEDATEETVETDFGEEPADEDAVIEISDDTEAEAFGDDENGADESEAESEDEAEADETALTEEPAETEEEPEPKKNRWTWVTTVVVIVSVLIILGLVGFVLYKEGTLTKWWDDIRPKTKSVCTIEDYSEIQVLKSAVEVSDETVASYVYSILGDDVTDEAVQAYSASHEDCDASTVTELNDYARDYIYRYYLHNEIMTYLKSITTVTSYDEVKEQELIDYNADELNYMASSYGMDADTIASYYGFEDALAYETETAHDYLTIAMILDQVMKDKGLSYTDEDVRADLEVYLEDRGYTELYTVDSFLEETGDTWLFLYENLTYKFNIAMEALEPNVVFIDEPAE